MTEPDLGANGASPSQAAAAPPWDGADAALGALAAVVATFVAVIIVSLALQGDDEAASGTILQLALTGALNVVFIGIVWGLAVRRRGASWSELGLRHWTGGGALWAVPAAVLAMLAIVVAYSAVIDALGWGDELKVEFFDDRRIGVLAAASALAIIAAPFVEEVFFRGFVLQGLTRHMTPVKAALLSSALFAVAHVRPVTYVPIFLIGLILALLFLKTRSLPLAMAAHAVYNAVVVAVTLSTDSAAWVGRL